MVVVALGEPSVPLTCCAVAEPTANAAARHTNDALSQLRVLYMATSP